MNASHLYIVHIFSPLFSLSFSLYYYFISFSDSGALRIIQVSKQGIKVTVFLLGTTIRENTTIFGHHNLLSLLKRVWRVRESQHSTLG